MRRRRHPPLLFEREDPVPQLLLGLGQFPHRGLGLFLLAPDILQKGVRLFYRCIERSTPFPEFRGLALHLYPALLQRRAGPVQVRRLFHELPDKAMILLKEASQHISRGQRVVGISGREEDIHPLLRTVLVHIDDPRPQPGDKAGQIAACVRNVPVERSALLLQAPPLLLKTLHLGLGFRGLPSKCPQLIQKTLGLLSLLFCLLIMLLNLPAQVLLRPLLNSD